MGRSGFVALLCALGCAAGTQGDDPLGATPDEGGSTGTAGSTAAGSDSGGSAVQSAGTTGTAGSESLPFGGFTNGGTFSSAGTFSTAGTGTGGGGNGGANGGAGGSGGKGGSAGSGGSSSGSGGTAGSAGAGGKTGGTCGSTKLTVTSASGTSENGGLLPAFAIDGDMTSRWGSEHSEPQNLDLDLGEIVTVKRVVINWEAAYATNYQVQIATNAGGPFTTVHTDAAGNGGTDDITLAAASDGRYVRMNGVTRKTMYGFSLYEISVYGDQDETCQ
ncbi:MAG TPA: discoidin domain-containing protein [Polyangiaceae bacterium]|nr:discoidin domain-containing protein [Polyangiaceae bacterium]